MMLNLHSVDERKPQIATSGSWDSSMLCTSRSTKSSRNPFIPLISLISAPYITIECLLSQQFAISDICFAHLYDTPHTHKPQALRWLIQALGSPLVGYCHKIVTPKMSVQLPQWFCSVSCLLGNSRKSVERFVCDRNSRLLTETFLYLFLLPADFLIARNSFRVDQQDSEFAIQMM